MQREVEPASTSAPEHAKAAPDSEEDFAAGMRAKAQAKRKAMAPEAVPVSATALYDQSV